MTSTIDRPVLDLVVVTINYNTPDLVKDCVNSILPELNENSLMVVVDNASPDGSGTQIDKWLKDHELNNKTAFIQSEENSGFSGGNNIGMRAFEAKYYLLINSDTLVVEGAIDTLIKTFDLDETIGLASPRLQWRNGEPQISCFRDHTPISELLEAASTNLITKLFPNKEVPIVLTDSVSYPEWTSFACVMISARALNDVGYMDEDYFLYYEDTDYCKMLRYKGWKIVNNPDAEVIHLRGGSSIVKTRFKEKQRLPRYYLESRTRYFSKHFSFWGLSLANIFWTIGASVSQLKSFLGLRESHICKNQFLDIWINFSNPMQPYEGKNDKQL